MYQRSPSPHICPSVAALEGFSIFRCCWVSLHFFLFFSSCTPKGLTNRVSLKSHFFFCFMLCYLSSAAPAYQNCRDSKAGLVSAYGRYM
ncbi:hypothetical protein M431DRAFT_437048 [Trichoderma harzianum CBS 226.95]|uniref:Uncharacterized protein n=1 Tax=Trichoderma harzianum CBS 226.95 TaxID=983964 RepID=A0A2T4ADB6_TRIHA|nr:hypothetical protein M431DRAFT_437048 [Trichoderma harzianum CBS 226.95]PTB55077.1 hypothetical protein M431DRAFT_437048 [Trichoderma harzianum CBS 226.95]